MLLITVKELQQMLGRTCASQPYNGVTSIKQVFNVGSKSSSSLLYEYVVISLMAKYMPHQFYKTLG